MIKPKRLRNGNTIGVIAPASPSENRSEVPRACEYIERLGYKVVVGKNVNRTRGFVAASEKDRADDFNEMFERDDIDAVFVTQGGYGSAQIINRIDFDMVKEHPKILNGFSDITSLHLAMYKLAGMVSFHGPGMARFNPEELTDYTREQFFRAIAEPAPIGEIRLADKRKWLQRISGGKAEGELVGGNLSLMCASMGTPYEFETEGRIVFFEDVDAEPWIVDGYLSQLRNAGKLDKAAGIVVGECSNCVPRTHEPGFYCDISLEDVLEYYLKPLGIPVIYGLPLGHTDDIATLPLGVMARLDGDSKTFTVLESGVR